MRDVGFCDILSKVRVIQQLKPNSNTLKETVHHKMKNLYSMEEENIFFFLEDENVII